MASRDAEDSVYRAAKDGLKRWLTRVREIVMYPWRSFKAQPNPQAIAATVPLWQAQVDRILAALTPALREGWAAAHLPGDFDLMDPYIQANLALTYNLLVRVPDEVHAMVVREILEGTNAGESTDQIAQRVDNVLMFTGQENWDHRSRVIAITETTRHRNSSLLAHGLLSEKNGRQDLSKQWDTTMDGRERLAHQLANDQIRLLGEPFIVDGEKMLFPGDPTGSPDNVCNCVPGSTPILSSGIETAFRFTWTGSTIDLLRISGIRTAVSPNHPVLTERGWVLARELVKGDQLICTGFNNTLPRTQPYEDHGPSSAEEVFESLWLSGTHQRMSHLSMNFYGDWSHSEVDVVSSNGQLRVGVETAVTEHLQEFEFTCANAPVAPSSASSKFILGGNSTPSGSMSFSDLIKALSFGHRLPLQDFGFRSRTRRDTSPLKSQVDSPASNVQLLSKGIDRLPCEVFFDEVIEVNLNPFATIHLYTFQTHSGIYIADGIVSHNCRCDLKIIKVGE